jgi:uncharacterized protein
MRIAQGKGSEPTWAIASERQRMTANANRRCCSLAFAGVRLLASLPDTKNAAQKGSRKEMKSPKFNSVDEFLASQDPAKERTLRSVIDLSLAEFPELESKISWNVPTIHRKGKYVAGICAYKHHLTFAPWSPRVIEDFKVRLGKFVVWKNCFPYRLGNR